jgi:putative peptidoglycan lipid II flippase
MGERTRRRASAHVGLSGGDIAGPRPLLRNTVIVTLLTLAAQVGALLSQLIFAALFGATVETDAFFAALALPLYAYAVVMSSVGVLFVPTFVQYRRTGNDDASGVVSGAINLSLLVLAACAIGGIVFADALLAWSAPGLSPEAHALARDLAVILWPSILGLGLLALLTEIWQVESRFLWSGAVPLVGALANLLLIVFLGTRIGMEGVAYAWTASSILQGLLLLPVTFRYWRPSLSLDHPGIRAILVAIVPLLVANVFTRAVTVVERYLGSLLPEGELSHVAYASRVVMTIAVLLSGGLAAVIFPRMAEEVAGGDIAALRATASRGFRLLWLLVAPVLVLVMALAEPAVRLVFEHGAFTRGDSIAVASLLRVYALALLGLTLAPIAGRALFSLKASRFLAVAGIGDTVSYATYTTVLARGLGAIGIAVGFTLHALVALVAYAVYLRRATHASGAGVLRSLASTTVIAAVAGAAAWSASRTTDDPLLAISLGTLAGLGTYVAALFLMRPPELTTILRLLPSRAGRSA